MSSIKELKMCIAIEEQLEKVFTGDTMLVHTTWEAREGHVIASLNFELETRYDWDSTVLKLNGLELSFSTEGYFGHEYLLEWHKDWELSEPIRLNGSLAEDDYSSLSEHVEEIVEKGMGILLEEYYND